MLKMSQRLPRHNSTRHGRRISVVVLDGDDDNFESATRQRHLAERVRAYYPPIRERLPTNSSESDESVWDEDEASNADQRAFVNDINTLVIDLTDEAEHSSLPRVRSRTIISRNAPVSPHSVIETFDYLGMSLRKNVVIEVQDESLKGFSVQFVKIKLIYRQVNGEVHIRGVPFTRTRNLKGALHSKVNEVCMLLLVDEDDPRAPEEQAAIDISISNVVVTRQLHLTNYDFPDKRFEATIYESRLRAEELGLLVCRWQYVLKWRSAADRERVSPYEFALIHLRADQVPLKIYRAQDSDRVFKWRGPTRPGGSYLSSENQFDNDADLKLDI